MQLIQLLQNSKNSLELLQESHAPHSWKTLKSLLGPAFRGLILQKGKQGHTEIDARFRAYFNWGYERDRSEIRQLYIAAKRSQWDSETALAWSTSVDPENPEIELFSDEALPLRELSSYRGLTDRQQRRQRAALLSWMLSQFLHGEQGALFAACQVTQAVEWNDAKLYGATQVMDEGRHVETFHRYLVEKLDKKYEINDNLYVIIDALMSDSRWDIKFLGMQILIEGLALGTFGAMRDSTHEPLLKELLKYVILDEGRHVHFGVVALREFYTQEMSEKERAEREDWAFEVSVLMKNRFLAHEFYDEYYAHEMSRKEWNEMISTSAYMNDFRERMFKRLIPNLRKIGLLSPRIAPHYDKLGLLRHVDGKAAHQLTQEDLLSEPDPGSRTG